MCVHTYTHNSEVGSFPSPCGIQRSEIKLRSSAQAPLFKPSHWLRKFKYSPIERGGIHIQATHRLTVKTFC